MSTSRPWLEYVNPAVVRLVGSGHSVLDLGCSSGALAEALTRAGNRVTGVDNDAAAIEVAAGRAERALVHDLTDGGGLAAKLGARFDRVVLADVLEHLPDPPRLLDALHALLAPGGRIVVSLPNVAAWTVRLSLLFGRFEYAESGIMDRTHLRWFTNASAKRMLGATGFEVVRRDLTPHLTRAVWHALRPPSEKVDPGAVLNSPAYRFYATWVDPVETLFAKLWPGALACQFVYECRSTRG
jgi:2-polyprenyl-3-methyl-5-hydroxy-6-metoxy-1,4-benzoquinol methylase